VKLHISRQTIYLVSIAFILLIIVLLFSFLALIPAGKQYRIDRIEKKKHELELRQYQSWYEETFSKLKDLQSQHKRAIMAYDTTFDSDRFVKMNQHFFEELTLAKMEQQDDDAEFSVYEVKASSKIDSPQSFYSFIEGVNKGDWVIGINFPIHFERQNDLIRSSFTIKVYGLADEKPASSESNASIQANTSGSE
jgi:hypothetical protein